MKTLRKLRPGQPGTKKLLEKYGEDLVCVRYRYDSANMKRITTVELIVEVTPWQPQAHRIPMNKNVCVRIEYGEIELGRKVKAAGGVWNRKKKLWELHYQQVLKLGLIERMVQAEPMTENV
jgi:hypothetical protein